MKKNLLLVLLLSLFLMPVCIFAKAGDGAGKEYISKNFEESLAEEGIKPEFKDYKEDKKQATIYLFRGTGCSFCRSFLSYLNSITDEYGDYFKVVSYEVWSNSKNSMLMTEVRNFFGDSAGGVPYIIIGDQVFPGYAEQYNEGIKDAIMKLYNSKDKYDVFEEIAKAKKKAERGNSPISTIIVIICNFVFIAISTAIILIFGIKKNKEAKEKIESLELALKKINKQSNKSKKEIWIIKDNINVDYYINYKIYFFYDKTKIYNNL